MLPFEGRNRVTQLFSKSHGGIDVVGDDNTQIRAVTSGVVDLVQYWDGFTKSGSQSYGNLIRIKSDSGIYVYYAHLSKINVLKNQRVNSGDIIGVMGNSGNSFGAHLHLEARKGKQTCTRICPSQICSLENKKQTFESHIDGNVKSDISYDTISEGKEIKLSNTDLFASSDSKRAACKKSGTFYIYSKEIINNRIRITCKKDYVGKKPIGKYVTGWIGVDTI